MYIKIDMDLNIIMKSGDFDLSNKLLWNLVVVKGHIQRNINVYMRSFVAYQCQG